MTLSRSILLALLFSSTCLPQAGGRLELIVTDSFGEPVREWKLSSLRSADGTEMKRLYDENTSSAFLPYGEYTLRLDSDVFLPFEAAISVRQPVLTYVAGLMFAGVDNVPPMDHVQGSFPRGSAIGGLCFLSGIYARTNYFARISGDGTFEFRHVVAGVYTLLCQNSKEVLMLRRVLVRFGVTPKITLDTAPAIDRGK